MDPISERKFSPATSSALEAVAEEVSVCMQCGTCAGSCPAAPAMDYTPRAIMRLLQNGLFDEALRSRAIWMCTTCYSCTVRCPRDIHVTDILGKLRGIAAAEGYAETAGMIFNKAFLDIVRRYGRMFEPELLIRYYLRQEPLGVLGAAPIGLALLQRGKIAPLPDRLPAEGLAQIRRIFEAVEARQKAAPAATSTHA